MKRIVLMAVVAALVAIAVALNTTLAAGAQEPSSEPVLIDQYQGPIYEEDLEEYLEDQEEDLEEYLEDQEVPGGKKGMRGDAGLERPDCEWDASLEGNWCWTTFDGWYWKG